MIVIWGLPKHETRKYMEEVLSTKCHNDVDVDRVIEYAEQHGWHDIRVSRMNDTPEYPDFISTIRPSW